MINYEKLKIAHELARKYSRMTNSVVRISQSISYAFEGVICHSLSTAFEGDKSYDTIDEIIEKLTELTAPPKPEPKYKVGQEVFYYVNKRIKQSRIKSIYCNPDGLTFWYKDELNNTEENDIFSSRESLVQSQIEYWQSLSEEKRDIDEILYDQIKKAVEKEECQHETDGMIYYSNPSKRKCRHCGEFYK